MNDVRRTSFRRHVLAAGVLAAWAAIPTAAASAADATTFRGPARIVFAGTPDSTNPRVFLRQIERTVSVDETPLTGGADSNTVAPYSNYLYNSLPFGNCGTLNSIGAALYSSLSGAPYRFRQTATHVTAEIRIGDGYYVLNSYTGSRLANPAAPGLFTMGQLEHDPAVWAGQQVLAKPLFEGVRPLEDEANLLSYGRWRSAEMTLAKGEQLSVRTAAIDTLDLWGTVGLDMHGIDWPVDGTVHGPTRLRIARLLRPAGTGAVDQLFEPAFLVSGAKLRPRQLGTDNFGLASALRVRPAAPPWAVDVLAGKSIDWTVKEGHGERVGGEWRVYPESGADGHLRLDTGYRNDTDHTVYAWLPFLYRTGTPVSAGGGYPVASFIDYAAPGGSRINLYPRNRDTRYTDLVFPVAPGKPLVVDLLVFKAKILDFAPASAPPEIKDVLSVTNPAMAVRMTTASPVGELYHAPVDIAVDFLINPFLEPRAEPAASHVSLE